MKTIKQSLFITILMSGVANAIPAPDFVKEQMESKQATFQNDYFNYGRIPGSSVTTEAKQQEALAMGYVVNAQTDSGMWSDNLSEYKINIKKPGSQTRSSTFFADLFAPEETTYSKVVFNYMTGEVAVITNELSVIMDSTTTPEEIANTAGISLKFYHDGMKTAFYEARDGTNMVDLRNEIMNYVGVKSVILDIFENEVVPN